MELEFLTTTGFRNLERGTVAFEPGVNVIVGGNGQGKTNLLEAIHTLGTGRSFRSAGHRSLVRHGKTAYRLEGRVNVRGGPVILELLWRAGTPPVCGYRINGVRVTVSEYLQVLPMVVLSGSDHELVTGPPGVRRAFMDRLVFLLEPAALDDFRRYIRILHQRNAALGRGGQGDEIAAWSEELATVAGRIVVRRRRVVRRLEHRFGEVYERLRGPGFPDLVIRYQTESWLEDDGEAPDVAEKYRKRYNSQGEKERETGYTLWGPHRHDLSLQASGRAVRDYLSAGQVKTVAAALRLAYLGEVEETRGEHLPLGIDDVDAELDTEMLARMVGLAEDGRQLFLTSAHGPVPLPGDRDVCRLWMSAGRTRRDGSVEENA